MSCTTKVNFCLSLKVEIFKLLKSLQGPMFCISGPNVSPFVKILVSAKSPETLWKLCISTKLPHTEVPLASFPNSDSCSWEVFNVDLKAAIVNSKQSAGCKLFSSCDSYICNICEWIRKKLFKVSRQLQLRQMKGQMT